MSALGSLRRRGAVLAFVRAQRSPYLATRVDLIPGTPGPDGYVLAIEFGAPAPLGMLQ
jgi:hypothetical protein